MARLLPSGIRHILYLAGCVFLLLFAATPLRAQQIPQYSQYLFNPLYTNPAYAGYRESIYAHLFYHNQWMGKGTPQYVSFAIDGSIAKGVNLGLSFSDERMGALALNNVTAAYAYRIQTSKLSDLSFGLALGVAHYGVNHDKLDPFEENDPLLQNLSNKWKPLIDVGMYYGSDRFYGGVALRNITNYEKLGTYDVDGYLVPLPQWYSVLTLGVFLPVTDKVEFRPSIMWQEDFAGPSFLDITAAMLFLDRFWIGVSFRTDQHFWKDEAPGNINELYSIALMGEVFITDNLTVSYAYDLGLNTLSAAYFGGHEVSVGYYLVNKVDKRFNRKHRYKKYASLDICWYCP